MSFNRLYFQSLKQYAWNWTVMLRNMSKGSWALCSYLNLLSHSCKTTLKLMPHTKPMTDSRSFPIMTSKPRPSLSITRLSSSSQPITSKAPKDPTLFKAASSSSPLWTPPLLPRCSYHRFKMSYQRQPGVKARTEAAAIRTNVDQV